MTVKKVTRREMTEDGLVTKYYKTSTDQVIEESTGKTLDTKLQEIEANVGRDFATEPIDLTSEVIGQLPKTNYELPNASEITFTDSNFVSTNTEDALKELFQFADSSKQLGATIGFPYENTYNEMLNDYSEIFDEIIQALENQGIDTSDTNNLTQIPEKIEEVVATVIPTAVNKTAKLNITAPYSLEIPLDKHYETHQIASSLIEYINDGAQNQLHYELNFDNTDEDDFIPNVDVSFDGKMKLSNNITVDMSEDEIWVDEGTLYRYEVTKNNFKRVDAIDVLPNDIENKSLLVTDDGSYKWVETPLEKYELLLNMTSNTAPTPYVASSSGVYSVSYLPFKTFDGVKIKTSSSNNYWLSPDNSFPCSISIDFGETKKVNNVHIYNTTNGSQAARIKNFIVQGSNDNLQWEDIAEFDNELWNGYYDKLFKFNEVSYRHYRLFIKSTNGFSRTSIAQIVYGYDNEVKRFKGWVDEVDWQDGMSDLTILNRKLTQLQVIQMSIKDDILPENNVGKIYTGTLDLVKYKVIHSIKTNNLVHKEGKTYKLIQNEIKHDINKMTSNNSPSPYIVRASSYLTTGSYNNQPFKAFDGSVTGFVNDWHSGNHYGNKWIEFDFGEIVQVDKVALIRAFANNGLGFPENIEVQYSNDGVNYVSINSFIGITKPSSGVRHYLEIPSTRARIFRLVISSNTASAWQSSLGEIEFYYNERKLIEVNSITDETLSNEAIIDYLNVFTYKISENTKTFQRKPLSISSNNKLAFVNNGLYYTSTDGLTLTQIQESEIEVLGFNELAMTQEIYDIVGELPTVKAFNSENGETTIETTVEPFTIYDYFGDSVEVVYYDPTGTLPTPSLSIIANWSPLDELKGDLEIVTLSEDSIPRQLYIEGERGDNYTTLSIPEGDINLTDVESIDSFDIVATGNGKISPSIDGGLSWLSLVDGEWTNVADASQGLTFEELNNLTPQQLELLKGDSNTIRFSYFITKDTEIDYLEMRVTMIGEEKLASSENFDWTYDEFSNRIIYTIKTSGTYSVNTLI